VSIRLLALVLGLEASMPRSKPSATLEIHPSAPTSAVAVAAALDEARAQLPPTTTRELACVLAWLEGATFLVRVALERNRHADLKAHLHELSALRDSSCEPSDLVALARGVRARAAFSAIHELLAGTQARAATVRAQTAARARAR
jgi:hypothetical protein